MPRRAERRPHPLTGAELREVLERRPLPSSSSTDAGKGWSALTDGSGYVRVATKRVVSQHRILHRAGQAHAELTAYPDGTAELRASVRDPKRGLLWVAVEVDPFDPRGHVNAERALREKIDESLSGSLERGGHD